MHDDFKIYIDRLSEGKEDLIQQTFEPVEYETDSENLAFPKPIEVQGKAYVAEDFLILHLDVKTSYRAPCKICNEYFELPYSVEGLYLTEELANISDHVYNYYPSLREAIILDIPQYGECEGSCPQREAMKKYMKQS